MRSKKIKYSLFLITFNLLISLKAYASPYLYKIEKNNRTSYLLGSIHGGIDLDIFSNAIKIMKTTKTLIIEKDNSIQTEMEQNALYIKYGIKEDGNIENRFPKEQLTSLNAILKDDYPNFSWLRWKAWVLNLLIFSKTKETLTSLYPRIDWNYKHGIDSELLSLAKEKYLKIVELDSIQQTYKLKSLYINDADLRTFLRKHPKIVDFYVKCAFKAKKAYLSNDLTVCQISRSLTTPISPSLTTWISGGLTT